MANSMHLIKKEIEKLLEENQFKINEKLPSEVEMAKYFNVSRVTYRSVVKQLEKEGKLYVKHGSGTFVVPPLPNIESNIQKLESIGEMIKSAGLKEDERHEKTEFIPCEKDMCEILKISKGAKVVKLERYRIADDEAISFSINFMPYDLVGKAFETHEFSGSLFRFLKINCDIEITCADSEFCVAGLDDKYTKKLDSDNKKGVALFKQLHYSEDNTPVLYSYDYLRNDVFKFCIRRRK